jgi:hypothetical protein
VTGTALDACCAEFYLQNPSIKIEVISMVPPPTTHVLDFNSRLPGTWAMRVTTHLLLIGPEEIHWVLAVGDDAEAEALICYMRVMLYAMLCYMWCYAIYSLNRVTLECGAPTPAGSYEPVTCPVRFRGGMARHRRPPSAHKTRGRRRRAVRS